MQQLQTTIICLTAAVYQTEVRTHHRKSMDDAILETKYRSVCFPTDIGKQVTHIEIHLGHR